MLRQYLHIKGEHPDCLLMYRMGDFYEMFFEDAVTAARELQIALTSRNRDKDNPDAVPMCGVPWHALQGYLAQLVDKGYRVAICDQVEDPKQASGLVKRAVTRIVTPGTVLDDANLEAKSHNYLGALYWDAGKNQGGFANRASCGNGCKSSPHGNCSCPKTAPSPPMCCWTAYTATVCPCARTLTRPTPPAACAKCSRCRS